MGRDSKWDQVTDLTARCYKATETGNTLNMYWNNALNALMNVVEEERSIVWNGLRQSRRM